MERLAVSSRAIIGRFYQTLEATQGAGFARAIGAYFTSDQESETYKWLGQSPAFRQWVGGRLAKGLTSSPFTITNVPFEATLEFDVNDLRRDKTGQVNRRIDDLALRANMHWDALVDALIAAGTSADCYDGQYFFDSDHAEGSSGTQLNLLTATQVTALDVTTAAAPTEAEMEAAILDVIAYMMGYKDNQGEYLNGGAMNFQVMAPANIWRPALAAVKKASLNTGSGVMGNLIQSTGFNIEVICNPRRNAATTVFYVFRTDGSGAPFILQEETGVQLKVVGAGSELEFNENVHHYGVDTSRNAGYGFWQYATHNTLS